MEKEETNALERLDGDDGNDDDRADEKNTNPLALAPTAIQTTTASTNTPTPTAVGETRRPNRQIRANRPLVATDLIEFSGAELERDVFRRKCRKRDGDDDDDHGEL